MNLPLDKLEEAKKHLAEAWLLLLPMEAPVEATGPNACMKHAREQLRSALANVDVLRGIAGGDRNTYKRGDRVLIVASIEQGITGIVNCRPHPDLVRVDYFDGRLWADLSYIQVVNLTR